MKSLSLFLVLLWPSLLLAENLAFHGKGGVIAWYTSRDPGASIGRLIDQKTTGHGWRSRDDYLPQEIVFAFKEDRLAWVDTVTIEAANQYDRKSWAKSFILLVSTNNPVTGFEEVGAYALNAKGTNQTFEVNRRVRFLKLRILENRGAQYTSLDEIRIEGVLEKEPQETTPSNPSNAADPAATGAAPLQESFQEQEPNDSRDQAGPLPQADFLHAAIDPPGEYDYFRIPLPGPGSSVVTFALRGEPNIRTSLSLLDNSTNVIKLFDPGATPLQETEFSWLMDPGDRIIHLHEPAISLVMIWDTSSSMRRQAKILQEAVESYFDAVQSGERLKMIRFSRSVQLIHTNFLSHPEALRTMTKDKFKTSSGTALYDAMTKGIELLENEAGNRAIILMTDGKDSASKSRHEEFWKTLIEKRIRLYTIGLGGNLKQYSSAIGTSGTRFLRHASLATDGRHFFADKAEELKGLYEVIARELRTRSTYQLKATPSQEPGSLVVESLGEPIVEVTAPPRVELILDASASMRQKIGVRYKMNLAKAALARIITDMPGDIQVALRFFGHRIQPNRPEACEDSELMVPFGPIDKPQLLEAIQGVRTTGGTPFAYTLKKVGEDFEGVDGPKSLVIVTDGKDECEGDPVAAVKALLEQGLQIRVNIVGFDLADDSTKDVLNEITELTQGRFYEARNAEQLSKALRQSVGLPVQVQDASGTVVAEGVTGQDSWPVPSGVFTVVVLSDEDPLVIPDVRIHPHVNTRVTLRKEGQEIGIKTTFD